MDVLTSRITSPADAARVGVTKSFSLKWTHNDFGGSGVKDVQIVWSKDGGPTQTLGTEYGGDAELFPAGTLSTTFVPSGRGIYSFYTIATDKAGNVEEFSGFDITVTAVQTEPASADHWRRLE